MSKLQQYKRKKTLQIVGEFLQATLPLVSAVIQLRSKPRAFDYVALAVAGLNAAVKGKAAYNRLTKPCNSEFFSQQDDQGEFLWQRCPEAVGRFILTCVERVEKTAPAESYDMVLALGYIGEELVGWEHLDGGRHQNTVATTVPMFYCLRARQQETLDALSRCFWKRLNSNQIKMEYSGFSPSNEDPGDIYITPDIASLVERVTKFLASSQPRAYLLEGTPGSGKSTAIQHLVTVLNLRSLRISPRILFKLKQVDLGDNSVQKNLLGILSLVKPDILILDDIDQIQRSGDLLEILTVCRAFCKVVIGSANNKWRLDGAVLRTGRFDDHIEFHALTEEVIKNLLGPYAHHSEAMKTWPVTYITDFVHKAKVLGEEVAFAESLEISKRIVQINESIATSEKPTQAHREDREYLEW